MESIPCGWVFGESGAGLEPGHFPRDCFRRGLSHAQAESPAHMGAANSSKDFQLRTLDARCFAPSPLATATPERSDLA
jgi:hypothetical protein